METSGDLRNYNTKTPENVDGLKSVKKTLTDLTFALARLKILKIKKTRPEVDLLNKELNKSIEELNNVLDDWRGEKFTAKDNVSNIENLTFLLRKLTVILREDEMIGEKTSSGGRNILNDELKEIAKKLNRILENWNRILNK